MERVDAQVATVRYLMGNARGRQYEGSGRQEMAGCGVLESRLITDRTIWGET